MKKTINQNVKEWQIYTFLSLGLFFLITFNIEAQTESADFKDNEILIKFPEPAPQSGEIASMSNGLSAEVLDYFPRFGIYHWQIADTCYFNNQQLIGVAEVVAYFKDQYFVELIEPNFFYQLQATPNDYDPSLLWGLDKIQAPMAWDTRTSSSSIVVGVLDTGIDYNHPDLQDNVWTNPNEIPNNGIDDDGNGYIDDIHGWDFSSDNDNNGSLEGDNDPFDDWPTGHGTHVSGTIAATGNNGIGITGVNWNAQIMALKIFSPNSNSNSTSTSIIMQAIDYATMMKVNHGIDIRMTNNSWGGGPYSSIIEMAIQDAENAGQLFIAAAGNFQRDNDIIPFYPATYSFDNIIAVASTNINDNLSSFSHYGATTVDLGAPGGSINGLPQIYSTLPNNNYGYLSGTSMAAPHVTGVAALLWAEHPDWTYAEIKERILCSVDPLPDLEGRTVSGGRLNVNKAFNAGNPDASFNHTTNGLSVDFMANTTTTGVSYLWDFGDGNTSNASMPTHTYGASNNYTVCLTVDDGCGSNQTCQPVVIDEDCLVTTDPRYYLTGGRIQTSLAVGDDIFVGTIGNGLVKINTITNDTTFFTTFNSDIPANFVTDLELSHDGQIWVCTSGDRYIGLGGVAKFDGTSPTGWTVFNPDNSDLPGNMVNDLFEASSTEVWIGTDENGLAKFDGVSSTGWTLFNTTNSDLPKKRVNAVLKSADGSVWVGTDFQLGRFNGTSQTGWDIYNIGNSQLPGNWINCFLEANNGDIFVGTSEGVGKFSSGNPTSGAEYTPTNSDLPSKAVYALLQASNNDIVVGTNNGMGRFNGSSPSGWQTYDDSNSDLPNNYVSTLTQNSTSRIFVGTVDIVNNDKQNLASFIGTNPFGWTTYTVSESNSVTNLMGALVESNNNEILIAPRLLTGTIAKFDGVSYTDWSAYTFPNPSPIAGTISPDAFIKSQDGDIIFGTTINGIFKFDGNNSNTSSWIHYNTANSGLPNNWVSSLLETADGTLIAGTYNSGLAVFDGSTWTNYDSNNSPFGAAFVLQMIETSSGAIFIGTGSGLFKLENLNNPTWTLYDTNNSDIPANYVTSILEIDNDRILVGTADGLAEFDGTNASNWTIYNENNSDLPASSITDLYKDSQDNIFVGTTGLVKIDTVSGVSNWQVYTVVDKDLPHPYVTDVLENSSGEIFVSTLGGLVVLGLEGTGSSLTPSFNAPDASCRNQTATFTNTTQNATDYEWQIDGTSVSTDTDLVHTFSQSGTYIVTLIAQNDDNCEQSYSESITVYDSAHDLELGPDTVVCGNGPITLDAGLADMQIYAWNFPDNSFSTSRTITANQSGLYTLVVWDQCDQTAYDEINVTLGGSPNINLGNDTTLCADSFVLDAGSWTTYNWSTGETTQQITVTQSGTYSIVITDTNGCEATDTINITLYPVPVIDLGPDIITCEPDTTLDAGSNWVAYNWSTGATTQQITVNQSGSYTITVTDANGCEATDEINVTFNSSTTFDLGPDATTCQTDTVLDAGNWTTYNWSTGATTQQITINQSGTYSVAVTDANGCTASDTIQITFYTSTPIDLGPDIFTCRTDTVLDAGSNWTSYTWSTGATTQQITVTQSDTITIEVSNNNGCVSTDTIIVYLDDDCVWPGDANYDQVVNNVDVLNVGIGNLTMDYPRPNATTNWNAEACPDWALNFQDGTNYKHADCNGDGTIDISDVNAIATNYNLTHNNNPTSKNNSSDIVLTPVIQGCNNNSPNSISFEVSLDLQNLQTNTAIDLYGIAFSLYYSNDFSLVFSEEINTTNSWLNQDNTGLLTLTKHFPQENRIDIAISRSNQIDILGSGSIGNIIVEIDETPINEELLLEMETTTITALLADETPVSVSGALLSETLLSPSSLDLGEDIVTCETSIELDAGITDANYLWSTGETTQTIAVTASGEYSVEVSNAYGCTISDNIFVVLDDQCVWPGDLNYDGTANNEDILAMQGLTGIMGPIRPNANTIWEEQACEDWDVTVAVDDNHDNTMDRYIDAKHVDATGDGTIGMEDVQAIFSNYNQNHNGNTNSRLATTSSTLTLIPDIITYPTEENGQLLEIDFYVEENQDPATLNGLIFSLNYGTIFTNAHLDFSQSALGTEGLDLYTLTKDFPAQGVMELGLLRTDLTNITLHDPVARFSATATPEQDTTVQVTVFDIVTIDNTGHREQPANRTTGDIPLSPHPLVELQLTAQLSGAFDPINNNIHTTLQEQDLLPTQQPFHTAPWNYSGNEGVLQTADLPAGMVDWVLVEIRNEQQQIITQRAAALLQNGQIADVFSGLSVDVVALSGLIEGQNYQVILRHRSHVDVLSQAFTISNLSATIDLTHPSQVVGGAQQLTELGNGQYGLIAGDFNGDGIINVKDHNRMMEDMGTNNVYSNCDADLDGHVLTNDFNRYQSNASHIGVGWVRY